MDDIDLAQTEIEHRVRACVAAARTGPSVEATGVCLNCGDPLPSAERRWCDAGCRDDWARLAGNGGRTLEA